MRVVMKRRNFSWYFKDVTQAEVLHHHLHECAIRIETPCEHTSSVKPVDDEVGIDICREWSPLRGPDQSGRTEHQPLVEVEGVRTVQVIGLAVHLDFLSTLAHGAGQHARHGETQKIAFVLKEKPYARVEFRFCELIEGRIGVVEYFHRIGIGGIAGEARRSKSNSIEFL